VSGLPLDITSMRIEDEKPAYRLCMDNSRIEQILKEVREADLDERRSDIARSGDHNETVASLRGNEPTWSLEEIRWDIDKLSSLAVVQHQAVAINGGLRSRARSISDIYVAPDLGPSADHPNQ
jgi:hypothetical protein